MKACPICNGFVVDNKCDLCGYIYNAPNDNIIRQWCTEMIEDTGGLDDFEYNEMATPTVRREIAVATWIIRCLGNSQNDKTKAVINAILERRENNER